MKNNLAQKIKLQSYDDLFGTTDNQVVDIPIEQFVDFAGHPFSVEEDEDMFELEESVAQYGVIEPVLARTTDGGKLEMVAGHRRKFSAMKAGIKTLPTIIRELTDDEAIILMTDSNLQRTHIKISEKAKAYAMKLEALKHQGKDGARTADEIGEKYGDSGRKVQRYVRLTYLIPELLGFVDQNKLKVQPAYFLSFLKEKDQQLVLSVYENYQKLPSTAQAECLKDSPTKLTFENVKFIIMGEQKVSRKIALNQKKIDKFFPKEYTKRQIEKVIYDLLQQWQQEQN